MSDKWESTDGDYCVLESGVVNIVAVRTETAEQWSAADGEYCVLDSTPSGNQHDCSGSTRETVLAHAAEE
jgi:hypothetical protein